MHAIDIESPGEPRKIRGPISHEEARDEVIDLVLKFLGQRWPDYLAARCAELGGASMMRLSTAHAEFVRVLELQRKEGFATNRKERRSLAKRSRKYRYPSR